MYSIIKSILKKILSKLGYICIKNETYNNLYSNADTIQRYAILKHINSSLKKKYLHNLDLSKSQIKQDLFALCVARFKKKGYFVEVGAANGIYNSNSFLLEDKFGWKGLLVEPAKIFKKELKKNRKAKIENRSLWSESKKKLKFNETKNKQLSTFKYLADCDNQKENRKLVNSYFVETITLLDLLKKFKAPKFIDYLSIDTEGSEYEILKSFDFKKYKISTITVEHNYGANRGKIFDLLISQGYERKFKDLSQFDDWYVLSDFNSVFAKK